MDLVLRASFTGSKISTLRPHGCVRKLCERLHMAVREKIALKNDGVVRAASPKQDIIHPMERVGEVLPYQNRFALYIWLSILLSQP